MAMLLRTRKNCAALYFRIVFVLSVTFIFVFVCEYSDQNQDFYKKIDAGPVRIGRRTLALSATNSSRISPSTTSAHTRISNTTKNCTPAAINDFPTDGFTRTQRQHGWIILHAILACYLFILLAVVCDDYFVPAIKRFCDCLNMKEDVAGATFMATASSSPELFINCVGTFVTEGDLGVGTVVGSAVFNVLAVPACCGLFGNMIVDLEWWSITRDSIVYGISVILLIVFLEDGRIYLYEAMSLVIVYSLYILLMSFNDSLSMAVNRFITKLKRRRYKEINTETQPLLLKMNGVKSNSTNHVNEILETELTLKDCEDLEESTKIWEWPSEESAKGKLWWLFTWPISFLLYMTTPDCRKYPKLYVLTFLMCIMWIGSTSYMVAWLITIIGDTLNIPDSVMGLTFLAAGTSVPEAVSSVIVTNQGHGAMGLSSSIGSNTFDILLCLGIPWLIKTAFYPKNPNNHYIQINSSGINYSAISLLSTLVLLYLSIAMNKFKLNWKVGLTCLIMYTGFLILASLIELNFFFQVNLPTCDR